MNSLCAKSSHNKHTSVLCLRARIQCFNLQTVKFILLLPDPLSLCTMLQDFGFSTSKFQCSNLLFPGVECSRQQTPRFQPELPPCPELSFKILSHKCRSILKISLYGRSDITIVPTHLNIAPGGCFDSALLGTVFLHDWKLPANVKRG
jgi:hypothetical protein